MVTTEGGVRMQNHGDLVAHIAAIAGELGLETRTRVPMGRKIWGRKRTVDVIVRDPRQPIRLGIACMFQSQQGTAEERSLATLEDMEAWPIRGLLVFAGDGYSEGFTAYLRARGSAVGLEELETWLQFFFDLDPGDA